MKLLDFKRDGTMTDVGFDTEAKMHAEVHRFWRAYGREPQRIVIGPDVRRAWWACVAAMIQDRHIVAVLGLTGAADTFHGIPLVTSVQVGLIRAEHDEVLPAGTLTRMRVVERHPERTAAVVEVSADGEFWRQCGNPMLVQHDTPDLVDGRVAAPGEVSFNAGGQARSAAAPWRLPRWR